MKRTDYQLPRWAAGLVLAALPMIGLASAPASVADDFDCIASVSLDCMMNDDDGFSDGGGFQPGDLVLPATGGPPGRRRTRARRRSGCDGGRGRRDSGSTAHRLDRRIDPPRQAAAAAGERTFALTRYGSTAATTGACTGGTVGIRAPPCP